MKTTTETTATQSLFIIPNGLTHAGYSEYSGEMFRKNIKETFNYSISDDEPLIQIWYTGNGSDNWTDHGTPDGKKAGRVSSLVPVSLLRDAKEGENITLKMFGEDIDFRVAQKEFRYRNHGEFEKVLGTLLSKFEARMRAA